MTHENQPNFCIRCGSRLVTRELYGALRPQCPQCNWIFFEDPKVAAGVLVEQEGRVLLVRRVSTPFQGLWTLPAGFVNAREDPAHAAVRECLEETGLVVKILGLHKLITGREHASGADIVLIYHAAVIGGQLTAGDDADEAAFFARDALPELGFQATREALGLITNQSD